MIIAFFNPIHLCFIPLKKIMILPQNSSLQTVPPGNMGLKGHIHWCLHPDFPLLHEVS